MDDTANDMPEAIPAHHGGPWPWLIGTVFPFAALVTFTIGHGAIDRATPDEARAMTWYLATAAIGTAVLVVSILRHADHMRAIGIFGGGGALLFAALLASLAQDSYGPAGSFGMFIVFVYFITPTVFFGYGTTLLVLGLRRGTDGLALACLVWGTIICVGCMLAALYHVFTLDRQVTLAREAHEAPMLTGVASVAVLGVSAWLSRRSKC